jgi:hypothetical protein
MKNAIFLGGARLGSYMGPYLMLYNKTYAIKGRPFYVPDVLLQQQPASNCTQYVVSY